MTCSESGRLIAQQFTEDCILECSSFCCGTDPWASYLNEWISAKSPRNGALHSIRKYRTSVWLFRLDDETGEIVGYSSLGKTSWRWPNHYSERQEVWIIPALAVASKYHGQPPGNTYATQIMSSTLGEASRQGAEFVVLEADVNNHRALQFYDKIGFVTAYERTNKFNDHVKRLFIHLRDDN